MRADRIDHPPKIVTNAGEQLMRRWTIIGLSLNMALAGYGMASPAEDHQAAASEENAADHERVATATENRASAPSSRSQAAPASSVAPPLSSYVGHNPQDKVNGVAFLDHPQVRAAILAAVRSPEIRGMIFASDNTTAPIRMTQGRLFSRSYDPASGGDVNWAVLMVADGSKAAVCYSTGVKPDVSGADWYVDGERAFTFYTPCPSETDEIEATMGNWPIGPIPG